MDSSDLKTYTKGENTKRIQISLEEKVNKNFKIQSVQRFRREYLIGSCNRKTSF